ncbi:hypothetical protein BpHYR1_021514 [Brachionus plicatilis]|uniref:Uncharacterized protein n=1 Tax=Brachionus plicatilis TaxID=10195 RepID=A0A3M7T1L0_BRAPC|nr:hypothetical protein BpHYR1_021514 [Brachionus plicatilis]
MFFGHNAYIMIFFFYFECCIIKIIKKNWTLKSSQRIWKKSGLNAALKSRILKINAALGGKALRYLIFLHFVLFFCSELLKNDFSKVFDSNKMKNQLKI